MRKFIIPIIVIVFLSGTSFSYGQNVEKEKEAIKKVITESSKAYYDRNFEGLSKTYKHDESIVKLNVSKAGYNLQTGWENISSNYKEDFKANPTPIAVKFEKTNFKIKIYNNSAWAVHDELFYDENGNVINKQKGTHFLEKVNGKWEIVYLSYLGETSYESEN